MSFTPEQIAALQAPLDPRHVKPPPQGKYGEYVDGHHVLSEANRIFGHDGWSYEITSLAMCSRVETSKPQVRVGYRCTVKATVAGVTREGAAVGTGFASPDNEADAHESAIKEAETDALKRALRSFGNTFGLALYDKTKADVQAPPPPTITEDQATELEALMEGLSFPVSRLLDVSKIKNLKQLRADKFEGAKGWITNEAAKMHAAKKQKEAA